MSQTQDASRHARLFELLRQQNLIQMAERRLERRRQATVSRPIATFLKQQAQQSWNEPEPLARSA